MSEPAGAVVVRAVLRTARSSARRRLVARVLVDSLLGAIGLTTLCALCAGWTLRGDLAALGFWVAAAAGSTIGLAEALLHARRRWGSDLRTARSVASHRAPLGPGSSPTRVREHRLLRHELLGATELIEAGDDPAAGVHRGSPTLTEHYVADVARRLCANDIDVAWALPRPRWRPRIAAALVLGVAVGAASMGPLLDGLGLLVARADGRPPTPPEPVWSSLRLRLHYPAHTGRPTRDVPNPSGALRVPAGTEVEMQMDALHPAGGARVVVNYDADELSAPPPPQVVSLSTVDETGRSWTGTFTVRASGTWTVVLLDHEDDELEQSQRRSAALPLSQEPDRAPEIELLPLPQSQREVRETDRVEVRFLARDDFGLRSAALVYQLPDGSAHRLTVPPPVDPGRRWRRRYDWDIAQIPVTERSEVLYWIEVRDNDPGLGLRPLPDPPGKLSRSATQRLLVRDDEAEHATNIVKLRDLRDRAVDLLAARMTTRAYPDADEVPDPRAPAPPSVAVRAALSRDLLHRSGQLLARLAEAIDALSIDTLARERDVATLTEIHGRLTALYRTELSLHATMPPRSERLDPQSARGVLGQLRGHNRKEITQLEDEIIRLDDLVDGQIIERLEGLVARLEATQRTLVELLEQLQAGDESVRAQIEQLEQRRREDLRRISEARAMLRKEIDQEFMNLDAFEVLERMQQQERLSEILRRGDVEQALEQARGELGQVQGLRDQVQQRLGDSELGPQLSEEERARMKLLRELSRLQDEQNNLRSKTRALHERWRSAVDEQGAPATERETAHAEASALVEALEQVNDARLGREGRRGLDDAKDALERLEQRSQDEQASALELAEAAEQATRALRLATEGSEAGEREGKQVRRARDRAARLHDRLERALPAPSEVLEPEALHQLQELTERQGGLRKQARTLLDDEVADALPAPGRSAMRRADRGMERSAERLGQRRPGRAVDPESQAWQGLQEALDSLRRGSPPPPPPRGGKASTEAERDRSLRDALMEAMREAAPDGYDEPVQRYYEELLR
ncbi:MAG: hypothetical protein AAGF11_30425 [Myxococcota bacterium]